MHSVDKPSPVFVQPQLGRGMCKMRISPHPFSLDSEPYLAFQLMGHWTPGDPERMPLPWKMNCRPNASGRVETDAHQRPRKQACDGWEACPAVRGEHSTEVSVMMADRPSETQTSANGRGLINDAQNRIAPPRRPYCTVVTDGSDAVVGREDVAPWGGYRGQISGSRTGTNSSGPLHGGGSRQSPP